MLLAEKILSKRTVIWVFTWVLALIGIAAYFDLNQLEDPEFTIKEAAIVTLYPGASPREVEEEVTDRLERALLNMGQLERVTSRSEPGLSIVRVRTHDRFSDAELPQVWDELRRTVGDAQSQLPIGSLPPIVYDDFGDVWSVFLTLSAPGGDYSLAELRSIAESLESKLSTADDVGKVEFVGLQDEAIYISFDPARLAAVGLDEFAVMRELASSNLVFNSGRVLTGSRSLMIRPDGSVDSIEDIASTRIPIARTSPGSEKMVQLSSIATIERGYVEPSLSHLRIDGVPALGITVSTKSGGDVVTMGRSLQTRLSAFRETLPAGVDLTKVVFQPDTIVVAVQGFLLNLVEAAGIVILVLLAFMGLRSGLIIGGVMLLTVIGTFPIMLSNDIALQRVSLGAFIIALGMLVDNAIVVLDGIQVRIERGQERHAAAYEVIGQTALPLMAATAVGVMAFAAIGTSENDAGVFCQSLLHVMLISLLLSWVTAMTVTPLLAIKFLPSASKSDAPPEARAMRVYRTFLVRCVRWRWVTLGGALSLFVGGLAMFGQLEQEFFPDSTTPRVLVHLWAERGTAIDQTDELAEAVRADLSALPGVEQVLTTVGQGAPRFTLTYPPEDPDTSYSFFLMKVDDFDRIAGNIKSIENEISARHPEVELSASKLSAGPAEGGRVQIRIVGPDGAKLRSLGEEVRAAMEATGAFKAVRNDWRERVQVVVPQIATDEAKRLGITRRNIGSAILESFQGRVLGVYREGDQTLPIILRASDPIRRELESMESASIWSPVALDRIPLSSVVNGYELRNQDDIRRRRNRVPTMTIHGDPSNGLTPDAAYDALRPALDGINMPPGYRWELGGQLEDAEKATEAMAPGIGFFFVLMVLVVIVLFNDLRQPVVIWLTVPLGIIGVTIGLMVSGQPFGFVSLLGLLTLVGLLIKNAIVMIDEADTLTKDGMDRWTAAVNAGVSRIRPVTLAAVTTVLGMIPLFFDAFFIGFGVALVGGLIVSTALTLIIVPVLYVTIFRAQEPTENSKELT